MKDLKVSPIKNGTVIDHITAGNAIHVLNILGGDSYKDNIVSMAINVKSKRLPDGKKDILKIENRYLDERETNMIALISPYATVNKIKEEWVYEKHRVRLPDEIYGIVRCPNPTCISNPRIDNDGNTRKEPISSRFKVTDKDIPIIRCYYCERDLDNGIHEYLNH